MRTLLCFLLPVLFLVGCATPSLQKIDDTTTKVATAVTTMQTAVAEVQAVVTALKGQGNASLDKVAGALDALHTAVLTVPQAAHAATPTGSTAPAGTDLLSILLGAGGALALSIANAWKNSHAQLQAQNAVAAGASAPAASR